MHVCGWYKPDSLLQAGNRQQEERDQGISSPCLSPTVLADFSYYISCKIDFLNSARSRWKFYFLPLTFYTKAHMVNYLKELVAQLCLALQPQGLRPVRSFYPWDFPGWNAGVGCHFFLQGILLTQRLNPVSCIAGRFFYHLSHQGRKEDYLR